MVKFHYIVIVLTVVLTIMVIDRNFEASHNFLNEEFEEIASYIPKRDSLNPKVSKVHVAWHLDHSLKTINKTSEAMEASNPNDYKTTFSLSRILVFTSGTIPRGVAESPRTIRPPKVILTDSLFLQLEGAKQSLEKIEVLHPNAHFKHPYFKLLNKNKAKRFLKIHTRHHLKIIRDILSE